MRCHNERHSTLSFHFLKKNGLQTALDLILVESPKIKTCFRGYLPCVQRLKACLPRQSILGLTLVWELSSHLPEAKAETENKSRSSHKFNQDFKNRPHKNIFGEIIKEIQLVFNIMEQFIKHRFS